MEYVNCPRCGKIFPKISSPICSECVKEEERQFEELKHYLFENPNNSMAEVSEATGVSIKRILRYIKEGRLEMSSGIASDNLLKCERCGRPISAGIYCDKCHDEYGKTVQALIAESSRGKQSAGMHSVPKTVERKK